MEACMNKIGNLVLKWSGAGKIWNILDGYKLYTTGALAILGSLLGLATEIAPLLSAHDTIGLYTFITHLTSDPNWIVLLGGFGTIAGAHKMDKAAKLLVEGPAVEVPPVVQ